MNICLISYDVAHLKTKIILEHLIKKNKVFLIQSKFKKKKKLKTINNDRPDQFNKVSKNYISKSNKNLLIKNWDKDDFVNFKNFKKEHKIDIFLVCISKIIPKNFLKGSIFINSHPGILPYARGVDSFKKSIIKNYPIGNTLHIINEKIDSGIILKRKLVNIRKKDNFKSLCSKMILDEIYLLKNFKKFLKNKKIKVNENYHCSHMKIKNEINFNIDKIFLHKKNKLILINENYKEKL